MGKEANYLQAISLVNVIVSRYTMKQLFLDIFPHPPSVSFHVHVRLSSVVSSFAAHLLSLLPQFAFDHLSRLEFTTAIAYTLNPLVVN